MDKYIGQRFGRYVVLSFAGRKGASYWYTCKCDCGTVRDVRMHAMTRKDGRSATRSCGCFQKDRMRETHSANTYRRKAPGVAAANTLFGKYRQDALKRNIGFEIDKERFLDLTRQRCFYCDSEPSHVMSHKTHYGAYIYNGVDRVDNTLGYTNDNCVTCCHKCNGMKGAITKAMIEKLYWRLCHPTATVPPIAA